MSDAFAQVAVCLHCKLVIRRAGRTRAPWESDEKNGATCRQRSDGLYYHEPS